MQKAKIKITITGKNVRIKCKNATIDQMIEAMNTLRLNIDNIIEEEIVREILEQNNIKDK